MNLTLSGAGVPEITAGAVPGTLLEKTLPEDTAYGLVPQFRTAHAVSGACEFYLDSVFTAAHAVALASETGEGTVKIGPPVNVQDAVVNVTFYGSPARVLLSWRGSCVRRGVFYG